MRTIAPSACGSYPPGFPPTGRREALVNRLLALLCPCLLCAGCDALPGFDDPEIALSPRYYALELEGEARMQSVVNGRIVNNPPQGVEEFGQKDRDDDVGGQIAIGDGFSGIEFDYMKVEIDDSALGVLTADFGAVPAGTLVQSRFDLEEFRVGYTAELFAHELSVTEAEPLLVRLGAGAALAHREGDLTLESDTDPDLVEAIEFKDNGLLFATARARLEYVGAALQFDWGYHPDFDFGGEFQGEMHDVEITASYTLEAQDVTFLVGYRYSQLPATGSSRGLRYDTDFELEGWMLGFTFRF